MLAHSGAGISLCVSPDTPLTTAPTPTCPPTLSPRMPAAQPHRVSHARSPPPGTLTHSSSPCLVP